MLIDKDEELERMRVGKGASGAAATSNAKISPQKES